MAQCPFTASIFCLCQRRQGSPICEGYGPAMSSVLGVLGVESARDEMPQLLRVSLYRDEWVGRFSALRAAVWLELHVG